MVPWVRFLLVRDDVPQTARDLMRFDTVTVPPDGSLREVLRLLVVAGIGGVPVVGRDGAVIGVLSATDVLHAVEQALDEDRDVGESDDLRESLQTITAADIATPDVIWVSPDTPVAQVAEIMRIEGIHRVLVGSRGRLDGILTSFDLLRAI